ncbi:putative L-xylulose-5-phosphate 3-epimerase [[Clostridium] ultunense Esp]|nr:putative L-xylulose-5-phosphate 3-epimerase [[Clostridium] ultunense Esp]
MKKGINEWSLPNEWSIQKKLEVVRQASFEGFEIVYSEEGFLNHQTKENDLVELKKQFDENHLEIPSIATGLLWKYPLTHLDRRIRECGIEIVKQMIRFAAYLKVRSILIVPGIVDTDTPYERAYELSQESILKVASFAKEHQVTIAVENVWNKFLLSPLEMRRFIEEINHESVKVYFDVGNILAIGYPEHWIQILGSLIDKVHVKDFKREIGTYHGFLPLLQGDVSWIKVMQSLKNIGYDDYLTVEFSPNRLYPVESIKNLSRALDVIMEGKVE